MMTQNEAWFQSARLGLFIHWGLYSHLAGEWKGRAMGGNGYAEQIDLQMRIPNAEYEAVAKVFDPVLFSAREWVGHARAAGARYMVVTAKHQDGFAMYGSQVSDYNIVKATPFGRDIIAELAAECRRAGIRLGLYYSNARDYHAPGANYNTHGNTWDFAPQSEADFEVYYHDKALPQVRELLTSYGEIAVMWFDVPYKLSARLSRETMQAVKALQPRCLVNSRVGNGLGDFTCLGDNRIPKTPLEGAFECCITMNDTWGYSKHDHNWKTPERVVEMAREINGKGGNMLLNVGPMGDGRFPAKAVEILRALGKRDTQGLPWDQYRL